MANVLHNDLIDQELLGSPVQMRRFPVVAAEAITAANGERGVLVSETPGERAMHRWSGKAFNADEHEIAREFRNSAKMDTSLAQLIRIYKGAKPKGHSAPASLNEALDQITFFLDDPTAQYRTLQLALSLFDQPEITRKHIKRNWIRYGRTPIRHFVPYTFFCLRLLLLFKLGVATSLIDQRPTNVLDLQYLFYLTFCMVFLSADKLHLKLAPLFLNDDQRLAASDDTGSCKTKMIDQTWPEVACPQARTVVHRTFLAF